MPRKVTLLVKGPRLGVAKQSDEKQTHRRDPSGYKFQSRLLRAKIGAGYGGWAVLEKNVARVAAAGLGGFGEGG